MNLFEAALNPVSFDDLYEHYTQQKCLVIEGYKEKFSDLVSLDDIERRLNDGCNASNFPQIIKGGERQTFINNQTPWAEACLDKARINHALKEGNSLMLSNCSQISPGIAQFCDALEAHFEKDSIHADAHLYISTNEQGSSYFAHRDRPQHKILLQAIGEANWQLFEPIKKIDENVVAIPENEQDSYLKVVSEFTLKQGDLLYMPVGVFHRVQSVPGPRVSISIPFYSMPQGSKMDRSNIPFKQLFI